MKNAVGNKQPNKLKDFVLFFFYSSEILVWQPHHLKLKIQPFLIYLIFTLLDQALNVTKLIIPILSSFYTYPILSQVGWFVPFVRVWSSVCSLRESNK